MGQKTNSIGLRVGLHRRWNNSWYGEDKFYKVLFFAQNQLDQFLKNFLFFYKYTKKSFIKRALLVNTRFIKANSAVFYIFAFFYKFRLKKKFFTARKTKRYKLFNKNRFVLKTNKLFPEASEQRSLFTKRIFSNFALKKAKPSSQNKIGKTSSVLKSGSFPIFKKWSKDKRTFVSKQKNSPLYVGIKKIGDSNTVSSKPMNKTYISRKKHGLKESRSSYKKTSFEGIQDLTKSSQINKELSSTNKLSGIKFSKENNKLATNFKADQFMKSIHQSIDIKFAEIKSIRGQGNSSNNKFKEDQSINNNNKSFDTNSRKDYSIKDKKKSITSKFTKKNNKDKN